MKIKKINIDNLNTIWINNDEIYIELYIAKNGNCNFAFYHCNYIEYELNFDFLNATIFTNEKVNFLFFEFLKKGETK